jgi:hypothetical protein
LNDTVVHAATQRLIDSLGCVLGAHDCEPAQIGRKLAAGEPQGSLGLVGATGGVGRTVCSSHLGLLPERRLSVRAWGAR